MGVRCIPGWTHCYCDCSHNCYSGAFWRDVFASWAEVIVSAAAAAMHAAPTAGAEAAAGGGGGAAAPLNPRPGAGG